MKSCLGCDQQLPLDSFAWQNKRLGKKKARCRSCEKRRLSGSFDPSVAYDPKMLSRRAAKMKESGDPRWQLYDHDWFFALYGKIELQDIGSSVGASKSEMTRVSKFHGVSSKNSSRRAVNDDAFVKLHSSGVSYEDLSEEFGISLRSVNRKVGELDIKRGQGTSGAEKELASFIEGLGFEVVKNDRSTICPLELDILIPSMSIAIEYNGLFWHSETYKKHSYHHDKWKACDEVDIRLLQIWEDDWRDRREVVKSMLRAKLGVATIAGRVFARKCSIDIVGADEADKFLDKNHLIGSRVNSVHLGLYHGGDLVALCSFARRGEVHELVRYATDRVVVGGFSRLVKAYITRFDPKMLKTFADLSVSDGGLYKLTGWTKDRMIPPSYSYIVNNTRVHRLRFQKKRFEDDPKLLYRDGLTISELAELNKIPRIYDAGKIRYLWRPADRIVPAEVAVSGEPRYD